MEYRFIKPIADADARVCVPPIVRHPAELFPVVLADLVLVGLTKLQLSSHMAVMLLIGTFLSRLVNIPVEWPIAATACATQRAGAC